MTLKTLTTLTILTTRTTLTAQMSMITMTILTTLSALKTFGKMLLSIISEAKMSFEMYDAYSLVSFCSAENMKKNYAAP